MYIKKLLRDVNAHYRFFILHDLSPYEKCQHFVSIRQLVRDLHINEFNATSFLFVSLAYSYK